MAKKKAVAPAQVTSEQPPEPVAPANQRAEESEYELPDSSFDPALDQAPEAPDSAGTPETPAEPSTPPEAPTQGAGGKFLPKLLVGQAKALGISDAEIAELNREELRDAIYALTVQKATLQRDDNLRRNVEREPAPEVRPEPEKPIDLGIDESLVDESVAKALKTLADELQAERAARKQLERRLGEVSDREAVRESMSIDEKIDHAINKLNRADLFGEGSLHDLPEGDERELRNTVVGQAARMASDKATIQQILAKIPAAFEKLSKFGGGQKATNGSAYVEETLAKRRQEFSEGGLKRPTSYAGAPEPKGPARAAKAVAKQMADLKMREEDFEPAEEASIPGD